MNKQSNTASESPVVLQQTNKPFHVLAKPIGPICNLDCEYCFYLEKENLYPDEKSFRMKDEVLDEFTRQYIEHHPANTREINFAWQGGEPTLMGVDFFRRALMYQKKYSRRGIHILNSIQTNGTRLDDEWGTFLSENDFLVGLSIDGPKNLHDRFRPDKGGNGSFDLVMRGLDILKKYQVRFNTLTCIQSENSDHPLEVYRFMKRIGSTYMQFIPIVEPMEGGGVSYRSVAPEKYGTFLAKVFDEWIEAGDIGQIFVQDFDTTLNQVYGLPSPVCIHAERCGRAVAIEHNGDVYSCDHFVDPDYRVGNIQNDNFTRMLDGTFQKNFGNDKRDALPAYCLSCEFLSTCNGGCPKNRVTNTPDGEVGLNYLCEGYKIYYAHTIPVFQKMAEAIRLGYTARDYKRLATIQNFNGSKDRVMVGRNDLCFCGSGRKFKKCCGS
jgi:uncharacterized protein